MRTKLKSLIFKKLTVKESKAIRGGEEENPFAGSTTSETANCPYGTSCSTPPDDLPIPKCKSGSRTGT